MANQNNGAVASALYSTLPIFSQTDHDYPTRHGDETCRHGHPPPRARRSPPGRRQNLAAAAMNFGAMGGGAGNGAGKNRIPQATSDEHLQQALQSLNAIHSRIVTGGTTSNHARAATAVQNPSAQAEHRSEHPLIQ